MEENTQEIVETVEQVVDVSALPAEIIEEVVEASSPIMDIYFIGLEWLVPMMMVIGSYIVLRHLIWNSLKFNYHHYLECGEFLLCWCDDGGKHVKQEIRERLSKELKCEKEFVSWFAALLMSAIVLAIHFFIALLWPVTIIFVLPLMIVRGLAYRKRQKIEFTQKLKGDHLNESV